MRIGVFLNYTLYLLLLHQNGSKLSIIPNRSRFVKLFIDFSVTVLNTNNKKNTITSKTGHLDLKYPG